MKGEPAVERWRHLRAIGLLPGVVAVVIPTLLVTATGIRLGWGLAAPWSGMLVAVGLVLIGLGLHLMRLSIGLFHRVGSGTLAPWDPPRRFVVEGIYRHVRNPMISGVFAILLGEAALLGCPALVLWFLLFACANAVYIPLVEEPGLVRRFGDDYRLYRRHVPRWIPRLRPWDGLAASERDAS